MYYGLSDLKAPRQHRNALHYLRVLGNGFVFQPKLSALGWQQNGLPPYFRWAAFFEGLCSRASTAGGLTARRTSRPHRDRLAPREIVGLADEVFITNVDARRVVRYSSSLAPERAG